MPEAPLQTTGAWFQRPGTLSVPGATFLHAGGTGRLTPIGAGTPTEGWMHYIWEKRDVYLNVAKAPSFLAPGDPECSRLCIAMATCSYVCEREREIALLYSAQHRIVTAADRHWAGGAACVSSKAKVDNGDIVSNPENANGLCRVSTRSWKTAARFPCCRLRPGTATCPRPPYH